MQSIDQRLSLSRSLEAGLPVYSVFRQMLASSRHGKPGISICKWVCALEIALLMGDARGIVAAEETSQGSTEEVLLAIGGDIKPAVRFSAHDLSAFKRHTATVREHDQQASSYEGVLLTDLLEKTGLPVGKQLRGTALSLYLLFEAADGHKVVFALPELDLFFTDKIVLLADRRDGKLFHSAKDHSASSSPTRSVRRAGFVS
jgi:hypothetical protein